MVRPCGATDDFSHATMLECPDCGESKLINVTILDDVVGPVMCESCVARTIMERRLSRLDESATSSNGATPEVPDSKPHGRSPANL